MVRLKSRNTFESRSLFSGPTSGARSSTCPLDSARLTNRSDMFSVICVETPPLPRPVFGGGDLPGIPAPVEGYQVVVRFGICNGLPCPAGGVTRTPATTTVSPPHVTKTNPGAVCTSNDIAASPNSVAENLHAVLDRRAAPCGCRPAQDTYEPASPSQAKSRN